MLTPRDLLEKLSERFSVLAGTDHSALPRHQTMRALIDWSYDLLSAEERSLLRKLSVFSGGFTLPTAAAAFGGSEVDELAMLDLLTALVDKSLVQYEPTENDTRYRLLESTRQYAGIKLADAGEADAAARAHGRALLAFAEQLAASWETAPDREWFEHAESELDNVRAALTWAFGENGDALTGQRLVAALREMFAYLVPAEGWVWVQKAQQWADESTPEAVRAALDLAEAQIAGVLARQNASKAAGERALGRARSLGDPLLLAQAQRRAGNALVATGRLAEGEALMREALATFRALKALKAESTTLDRLAFARALAGDTSGARRLYEEALTNARAAGAQQQRAWVALNFAEAEFHAGDATSAVRLAREALAIFPAFHDRRSVTNVRCNEAAYLVALREYDEARTSARDALVVARDVHHPVGLAFTLQHLAAIAAMRPDDGTDAMLHRRRSALLLGFVDARLQALDAEREYTEQQEYEALLTVLRGLHGDDAFAALLAEGSAWDEDRAVAEAMLV